MYKYMHQSFAVFILMLILLHEFLLKVVIKIIMKNPRVLIVRSCVSLA